MNPHETAFVESFIVKARRERVLGFLANSKKRRKFIDEFDHHGQNYSVPECIRTILPRLQHPSDIADILARMGAPAMCHFIGGAHDGEEMDLLTALEMVIGYGQGTVLSCIPGQLAYFEGEFKERFLLVRPPNKINDVKTYGSVQEARIKAR